MDEHKLVTLSTSMELQFCEILSLQITYWGPDLLVIGDSSCLKGCGFESRCRILDGHLDIFHIYLL